VSHWLGERNFECLEESFSDLEASQARFPDDSMKVVSFLGGARDLAEQQGGMTQDEIAEVIAAWRKQFPQSLLPELMEPRLLMAAAWAVRGGDYAQNVAPDRMREFRRLNEAAMKLVRTLSPAAREHVMGHYIALRALADNGATREEISRFALEALRRFPAESGLAVLAGQRMLPKWGGSNAEFERFAVNAMGAVGTSLAPRVYATLYVEEGGLSELHKFPMARRPLIKSGLMQLATTGSFEAIATLQAYACTVRDAEALRYAQDQWATYARQPQVRAPGGELDAPCRQWARTLPSVAKAEPKPPVTAARTAAGTMPPPLSANPSMYRVSDGPWQRMLTPVGEVFSCTVCEYPVQVLIAIGPTLGAPLEQTTNENFLAGLQSDEDRDRVARSHIEIVAQLDPAGSGYELKIEKTGFGEIDGVKAFNYESSLRLRQRTMRGTAWEFVHRGNIVRISVQRVDGPVGAKEREAVLAFISGFKLVGP
jgi:hypothetical protein